MSLLPGAYIHRYGLFSEVQINQVGFHKIFVNCAAFKGYVQAAKYLSACALKH